MVRKKEWVCTLCGKPTEDSDKVCVVCRTDTASVKGAVSKKTLDE